MLGTIPFKGQVLNQLAAYWFEKTKDIAPNHVLGVPDPNVLECVECTPLPVEMVVRAYVTGVTSTSIWTHYAAGKRVFCGNRLPDGMRKHQRLPEPILTPSTKAEGRPRRVGVARRGSSPWLGHARATSIERRRDRHGALQRTGKRCARRGLILVDTKYEFGKTPEGEIVVIDEIHTPDSSRFWVSRHLRAGLRDGPRSQELRQGVRAALARQPGIPRGVGPCLPFPTRSA